MSAELTRQLRFIVETVTPVHVGDGRGRLIHDVDFVVDHGVISIIDPNRLWDVVGAERLASWNELDFRLSQLLQPADYPACAAASFPMVGHLDAGGGLLNQIADVHGRPYLPGSSLKGAIRTALLRASGGPFDLRVLDRRRQWAGQPLERQVFGRSPNYDLLRALRISDSTPLEQSTLRADVVAIYSLRGTHLAPKGRDFRLNVVTFPANTRLECRVSIDRWTLNQPNLRFSDDHRGWLEELAEHCRGASRELIVAERRFYAEFEQPAIEGFYQRLESEADRLPDNSFFLPLGWGTGWLGKTIGPALRDDEGFPDVRRQYRLGYPEAPYPFPKSRRLVESAADRPETPVGWVKLTIAELAA